MEYQMSVVHRPTHRDLSWLPEGPWSRIEDGRPAIYWVAIQHGKGARTGSLNTFWPGTDRTRSYPLEGRPGFTRPTTSKDTIVIGLENRLGLYNLRTRSFTSLGDTPAHEDGRVIINDGTCGEDFILFGTKDCQFEYGLGALYLYHHGKLSHIHVGETCANGNVLVRRPDGALTLYHIDTKQKHVAKGVLDFGARRWLVDDVAVDFGPKDSFPDGMYGPIPGPDGPSALIAMFNPFTNDPGEVRQYGLHTGRVEAVWHTPKAPQVTCPTLYERDGTVYLLATTAAENMTDERLEECPDSGALFECPTDFKPSDLPPLHQFKI
ncbi:MAG: SMP-30/gluconolactonase/LRE family protein [Bdellovibrionota bacterium]